MSKVLIVVIAIIVIVAVFMVAKQFQGVKFGNVGSLFRVNYNVPSGLTREQPNVSYSAGGSAASTTVSSPAGGSPKPAPTPPEGFTAAQLSPYYGEVKIGNVSAASSWSSLAQFSLTASYGGSESPIDVTGWVLKSNRGGATIPTAAADYNPSGFESSGDILLRSGDTLNVYSSVSPVGVNFRMNQCIGYLNNQYKFSPSLPQNCVSVYDRSEIVTFSGACQNYILSLWSCSVPTPDQINNFSGEPACQAILNSRFNYNTCYSRHRFDSGFFTNEWRVWIGGLINFDPSHDRILLFDRDGLLVDEYIY